ncbi:MAG: cyclic nucleotide-binding domain-containing protein [Acidobacteriota bacterium]
MKIQTFEKVLAEHPFFRDLRPEHLDTLVGCAANVKFAPGEFVFREGQRIDHFWVIREGKVAIEVFVPNKGEVTIETVEGGEVLGWSWLFPPYKAHFDARALTHVRALSLDGACLRGKCEKDTALGYEFMRRFNRLIVERLEATRMQLLDLFGDDDAG